MDKSAPWDLNVLTEKLEWHRAQGSAYYGLLIPGIIASCRARTAIEIGICNGWTSMVMARALALNGPGGALISCDINPQCCQVGRDAVRGLPVDYEAVVADSTTYDWAAALKRHGRAAADFALVDGDHMGDVPALDIEAVSRIIAPNGFILVHDYGPGLPDVWNAVNGFGQLTGWPVINIPESNPGFYASALIQRRDR